jgi:hypothetical protein
LRRNGAVVELIVDKSSAPEAVKKRLEGNEKTAKAQQRAV